jgi:CHASE2 domain-containing sensor protein
MKIKDFIFNKLIHFVLVVAMTISLAINFDLLFNLDFMNPLQNTIQNFNFMDLYFSKYKNHDNTNLDTNIVLVNIGNLNRREIAMQLDIINSYNPSVIGIDAMFARESNPESDLILAESFSKCKNLVLTSKLVDYDNDKKMYGDLNLPLDILARKAQVGFTNFYIEYDKDFRTSRLFSPFDSVKNSRISFFAAKIVELVNKDAYDYLMKRNKTFEIINFKRNFDKYLSLDVEEVFDKKDNLGFLNGKIVLMGFMGPNMSTKVTEDNFFTPMNRQFLGRSQPDMYGVVIHANIISMILEKAYINSVSNRFLLILTFMLNLFIVILYSFLRSRYEKLYEASTPIIVLLSFAIIYFSSLMIVDIFHYMVDVKLPLFTLLIITFSYEIYFDSLLPLWLNLYNKLKSRFALNQNEIKSSAEE